jgi:hypothetical protein
MLPEAQDPPTACLQPVIDSAVTRDVCCQLRLPISLVRSGHSGVLRTGVPEAAVDEHRQTRSWEGKVDPDYSATVWANREVNPIAQPHREESAAKPQFGLRVATSVPNHGPADGIRSWFRNRRFHDPDSTQCDWEPALNQ